MEKGDFWFKFEWRVWRTDPALRKLSPVSRSRWMDILCDMAEARTYFVKGTPEDLANSLGITVEEFEIFVADLKRTDTGDVRRSNGNVTLVSRRRKREFKSLESTRLRVARHRDKHDSNGSVTPVKRDRVRNKSKSKNKRSSILSSAETLNSEVNFVEPPQEKPAAPTKRKTGTRLPEPFNLTKPMREWSDAETPTVDVIAETKKFVDHFRQKTGKDASSLDWVARWRNWMRNARDGYGARKNGTGSKNGNGNSRKSDREILEASAEQFRREYGEGSA